MLKDQYLTASMERKLVQILKAFEASKIAKLRKYEAKRCAAPNYVDQFASRFHAPSATLRSLEARPLCRRRRKY